MVIFPDGMDRAEGVEKRLDTLESYMGYVTERVQFASDADAKTRQAQVDAALRALEERIAALEARVTALEQ